MTSNKPTITSRGDLGRRRRPPPSRHRRRRAAGSSSAWRLASSSATAALYLCCCGVLLLALAAVHVAAQDESPPEQTDGSDNGMSPELGEALGLVGSDTDAPDLGTGTTPGDAVRGNSSSTGEDGGSETVVDLLGDEDETNSEDGTTTGTTTNDPPTPPELLLPEAIFERKSRRWNSIVSYRVMQPADPNQGLGAPLTIERDAFKFTEVPSAAPSDHPTSHPSSEPSSEPSLTPTLRPSSQPSSAPSESPTPAPTYSPTENIWITEPEPDRISDSYFDYRPDGEGRRGLEDWDRVDDPREADYWREFQEYIEPSLSNNKCGSGSDRQSPIDVRLDEAKGQCFEYHHIRSKPGEYSIEESVVEKQILPSKLRFVYPVKVVPDAGWATTNDMVKGPSADVPKGWGHQLPVTHVDIKVPSEHWMEGRQYVAEYQIYLIQNRAAQRGGPAVSILLDLHPENKQNRKFQIVLDAFQEEWDYDLARCEDRMRKQRRLGAMLDSFSGGDGASDEKGEGISTWLDEPEEEEVKFQRHLRDAKKRTLQIRKFNPWTDDLMVSPWFFGYEGSLTEPPCTEFIEWRIIDKPGLISIEQLHQLKKLLFWHVDRNCDRTSVHYYGSVARPPQPYKGRWVHRCMCRDFLSDKQRDEYGENRCLWTERDQFGFDKDIYTGEWYDRTHKYDNPWEQPKGTWQSRQ